MKIKIAKIARVFIVLGLVATGGTARGQTSFSMQLVADNDFAVFGGTAGSVDDLLYQNNSGWPDQISDLSAMNFTLQSGDTMFYVLGLGGGGQENISGTVNGIDMTTIDVSMSSDIGSYLTGYSYEGQVSGTVAAGTFDANLADVQAAFPNVTWGPPTISSSDTVIQLAAPHGVGFHFNDSTAVLFSFQATEVGVAPVVPEPSAMVLAGLGGLCLFFRCRKPSCKFG